MFIILGGRLEGNEWPNLKNPFLTDENRGGTLTDPESRTVAGGGVAERLDEGSRGLQSSMCLASRPERSLQPKKSSWNHETHEMTRKRETKPDGDVSPGR
jgi:hypothetical protein